MPWKETFQNIFKVVSSDWGYNDVFCLFILFNTFQIFFNENFFILYPEKKIKLKTNGEPKNRK